MPRLSDSMEEGTIVQWLVAEGERVERGQSMVEIETLAVGETIARLGDSGEGAAAPEPEQPAKPPAPAKSSESVRALATRAELQALSVSPVARRIAEKHAIDLARITGS